MRPTSPGFHKGDIVPPRPEVPFRGRRLGVRPATQAEQDAWYKAQREIAPHDCAGESWIHDGSTSVVLFPGAPYKVIRGRCSAYSNWTTRSGYCEIEAPDGTRCKADRRDLVLVTD